MCTGNVARSQMAEGLLRHLAGERFEVFSGGVIPSYVRPNAITVMKELGIDISDHRSKSVNEFIGTPFDYVITVCDYAAQRCPTFPGDAKRIHWSIEDPVVIGDDEAQLEAFRTARDDLKGALKHSSPTN
jgi:arsenate reductase